MDDVITLKCPCSNDCVDDVRKLVLGVLRQTLVCNRAQRCYPKPLRCIPAHESPTPSPNEESRTSQYCLGRIVPTPNPS